MNNSGTEAKHLEPRAKIGDVVIVKISPDMEYPKTQAIIKTAQLCQSAGIPLWHYTTFEDIYFKNEDILKNLTTNTVYA